MEEAQLPTTFEMRKGAVRGKKISENTRLPFRQSVRMMTDGAAPDSTAPEHRKENMHTTLYYRDRHRRHERRFQPDLELTMEIWSQHLRAASGYLDLGMIDAASDEIENIEPEEKMRFEALAFRVDLFRRAQKWDGMEVVARHLAKIQPGEPRWCLDLAWAVRRGAGAGCGKGCAGGCGSTVPLAHHFHFLPSYLPPEQKSQSGGEGGRRQ